MEREIVLSSYNVKNQGNNTPQNFITKFNRPIILDSNSQCIVGLNRIINMSFTWFNVNPSYANQIIKYSSDNGSTFHEITFPAGVWNYTGFNEHIKDVTKIVKNGDTLNDNAAANHRYLTTCRLEYGNGVFYPETEYDLESKVRIFNDLMSYGLRKNNYNSGTQLITTLFILSYILIYHIKQRK